MLNVESYAEPMWADVSLFIQTTQVGSHTCISIANVAEVGLEVEADPPISQLEGEYQRQADVFHTSACSRCQVLMMCCVRNLPLWEDLRRINLREDV